MPSKAALLHRARVLKGEPLISTEERNIIEGGMTMNVPKSVHKAGPTNSAKNTKSLIEQDSCNLALAVCLDADAAVSNARELVPATLEAIERGATKIKVKTNDEYDTWLRSQLSE